MNTYPLHLHKSYLVVLGAHSQLPKRLGRHFNMHFILGDD